MTSQTIYIIDDDKQTVGLLAEYAKLLGYQASTYTMAESFFDEADAILDNSIIILDLNMPGMDGIEVMRRMVKIHIKLPLILISGYDSGVLHSAEQLAKAYSLDIIATIAKPFKYNDFKNIIQKHTKIERRQVPRSKLTIKASELETGIQQKQLVLYYQPQISIQTGIVTGVEALVRWQHPEYGLIFPNEFISLAETSGLIEGVTEQVIKQAIDQTLYWKSESLEVQISINISAENITSLSLPEQLTRMLQHHSIDPAAITLEVTESALMGKLVTSLDILTRLRMKGISLSIDDFGTGYSSLSQLYRMPFTELKVDQSFVANMTIDDEAYGIVKTCIMLGHELKMQVVAEGVENSKTLSLLKKMGCDIAQGYYIARPMPAGDLIPWMNRRKKNTPLESVHNQQPGTH